MRKPAKGQETGYAAAAVNERNSFKRVRASVWAAAVGLLSACQPPPPTYWNEGGARLTIPRASLNQQGADPVEIYPDGRVVQDGEVLYVLDRVGRVTDEDLEALALLLGTGQLVGSGDEYWGRIGLRNATPPWSALSWLRVTPKGRMLLFDETGAPMFAGQWTGCDGPGLRTCTLVSQLLTLEKVRRRQVSEMSVGVGFAVWQ